MKVKYNYIGQANDDGVYNIKFDSQSILKVTLNDILPNNWKINIKENATLKEIKDLINIFNLIVLII